MKDIAIGFLCGISLFILVGATSQQISNDFKDPAKVYNEMIQIRKELDENRFQILRGTPTVSQLQEGQGVLVSTNTKTIVFRIDNATYSVNLNKN